MIREGDATPAWLANDFNAGRRRAMIVAQVIKLGQKLTDDAVMMFMKLIGRLFSQANNRKKQRHMNSRVETSKALRLFLDTISALQVANDNDEDAIETLNHQVGWHRLLQMKPGLIAMVKDNEASPLSLAVEQYGNVRKYVGPFLQAFTFHSTRRHDPLLAALATLRRLHTEGRRVLPDRIPVAHLRHADRKLIFGQEKPNRRPYEIATLAVLRDRLRSADVWVEGSRSFRPINKHLMPRSKFNALKEEGKLDLGVHEDGLKKLAASSKSSELAKTLRELGRIERSLFMIEWYSSPALRRRCQAGLNKGEAAHKLKRAVFFHERGEIRDRSFDSQAFRASGLNLVVSAIVHWNTVYLSRAAAHLRQQGRNIPDRLLKHVSPLSWEHINLTGIYSWHTEQQRPKGFRPLRLPGRILRAA